MFAPCPPARSSDRGDAYRLNTYSIEAVEVFLSSGKF
jgi:hypothetical protein